MDNTRAALLAAVRNVQNDTSDEGKVKAKALMGRVERALQLPEYVPPPADNAMRDLMAQEAVRCMRTDRDRALAKKDMRDDDALLRALEEHSVQYANIVRMISLVARFAGELKHTLIHPTLRNVYDENVLAANAAGKMHELCEGQWDKVMDPGLSGNARIACANLSRALPQLGGVTVEMVLKYSGDDNVLDYFCSVVAARWRASSVFAAGPYKTGNEQNAVTRALKDAVMLCREYTVVDSALVHTGVLRAPTTLAELRGRGSNLFYQGY